MKITLLGGLICCSLNLLIAQTEIAMRNPERSPDSIELIRERPAALTETLRLSAKKPKSFLVKIEMTIHAEKAQIKRFDFAYQDEVTVFFNNAMIYFSSKGLSDRGLSLDTPGDELFDYLYLPLKKGVNVLKLEGMQTDGGIGIRGMLENLQGVYLE